MEVAGYVLGVVGGLLIGFPYLPFLKSAKTVQLSGAVQPSLFTAIWSWMGFATLFTASLFLVLDIQGPRDSELHPLPLKTFIGGIVLIVVAAIWRMVTAIASLLGAGSYALPAQLLGVLLVAIGSAFTVAYMLTKQCAC